MGTGGSARTGYGLGEALENPDRAADDARPPVAQLRGYGGGVHLKKCRERDDRQGLVVHAWEPTLGVHGYEPAVEEDARAAGALGGYQGKRCAWVV